MIDHLLTAHPVTGAIRALTSDLLREALLLPRPRDFDLMPALVAQTDAPWAESFALAPAETAASISAELSGLILAAPNMQPNGIDLSQLPDSRAARHLAALIALWRALDEALTEALDTIRRAIAGEGIPLEPLPLLDLPLPDDTPAAIHALRAALVARFGLAPVTALHAWQAELAPLTDGAPPGCTLAQIQRNLLNAAPPVPQDDSLTVWGLRDLVEEAEACAAMAQNLIEQGTRPQDIALLVPEDAAYHRHLARAFARVSVPLSGLPNPVPERDLAGEALTHLLSALQNPAPAMAVASLYALPGLPWPAETGAALAREALDGRAQPHWAAAAEGPLQEITGLIARPRPTNGKELRQRFNRFLALLPDSRLRQDLQTRLSLLRPYLLSTTAPDWALLTALAAPRPVEPPAPLRIVEGVSIIREGEQPWRLARILMVLSVSDGRYPRPPANSPIFMDSERATIAQTTGLQRLGRAKRLARDLALFQRQIALPSQQLVLFCPRQGLDESPMMPGPPSVTGRALHRQSRRPRPTSDRTGKSDPRPASRPCRISPLFDRGRGAGDTTTRTACQRAVATWSRLADATPDRRRACRPAIAQSAGNAAGQPFGVAFGSRSSPGTLQKDASGAGRSLQGWTAISAAVPAPCARPFPISTT